MSINESWWRTNLHMDADGGADGGGDNSSAESYDDGTDGAQETGDSQSKKSGVDKLPSYFSQFKKENREKYSALSKCKSLDELAELALKGDSYKEPDYTGYLKMPTGESSKEEIQEFLTKLGVPEGPDKYSIPEEKNQEPFVAGIEKTLREAAFRSGMTDKQTKNMWGVMRAVIDTAQGESQKYMEDRKNNFDTRYSALFNQYSQQAQKDAAIKESLGYFKTFITETGIGKALESSGAIYDENLVKALADYQKRNRGEFKSGSGSNGREKPGTMIAYSDEFMKEFGKR